MLFTRLCASASRMKNVNETDDCDKRSATGLNTFATEVTPLLRRILGKKATMSVDILMSWGQIVGDELAEFTQPEKITFKNKERTNGVLWVNVANGAFAMELQHRERFVLEKVNSFFGYNAVSSLKIKQTAAFLSLNAWQNTQQEQKKKLVSREEQNYIEQLTEGLKNKNLKENLKSLGESVFSDNKNTDRRENEF